MTFDDVEAYLAMLSNALRKRGVSNPRMIEEARGHLADAVADGIRRGLDPHAAQRDALAQFGSAESVAATFVAETYGVRDRLVLLAAAMMGIAIAYVDSRPNWDDTGITAFALVMAGAMCGFVAPRRAWRWALAAGIWISIFAMFQSASPGALVMLIVVVFPLAGAYAGAATRRAVLRPSTPSVERYQEFPRQRGPVPLYRHVKAGMGQSRTGGDRCRSGHTTDSFFRAYGSSGARAARQGPLGNERRRRSEEDAGKDISGVVGEEKKVLCRIEIGPGGKRLSVHWSRPGN